MRASQFFCQFFWLCCCFSSTYVLPPISMVLIPGNGDFSGNKKIVEFSTCVWRLFLLSNWGSFNIINGITVRKKWVNLSLFLSCLLDGVMTHYWVCLQDEEDFRYKKRSGKSGSRVDQSINNGVLLPLRNFEKFSKCTSYR